MRLPRPKFTLRRCLIGIVLVALILSVTSVSFAGRVRGAWITIGPVVVFGAYWNGWQDQYEACFWTYIGSVQSRTGRIRRWGPVAGVAYDPKKHTWIYEGPLKAGLETWR
jgi:hypothetical protein